jgi:hypothetical protein
MIVIAPIPPCRAIFCYPMISHIAAGSRGEGKGSTGMADAPDLIDRHNFLVASNWRDGQIPAFAARKIRGFFPHVSSRSGLHEGTARCRAPLHLIDINNGRRRAM